MTTLPLQARCRLDKASDGVAATFTAGETGSNNRSTVYGIRPVIGRQAGDSFGIRSAAILGLCICLTGNTHYEWPTESLTGQHLQHKRLLLESTKPELGTVQHKITAKVRGQMAADLQGIGSLHSASFQTGKSALGWMTGACWYVVQSGADPKL